MKKKSICLFLTFVLVLGMAAGVTLSLPCTTQAQTSQDYEYEILTDGTISILKYTGNARELMIPAFLDGRRVTAIGEDAFAECYTLERVKISEGITTIGRDAFFSSDVEEIEIPKSVTEIGKRAVNGCAVDVDLENPVYASVEGTLFNKEKTTLISYSGKEVSSYQIPDGVKVIAENAFYASPLVNVKISNSVESIGKYAFCFSTSLKEISLPEKVESIANDAFDGCKKLEKITIYHKDCKISASEYTIPENTVIYGQPDSTAKEYAIKYKRVFKIIGDVSCDHTYKTTTTKATLKKNGNILKRCSKCGEVSSKKTIYYPKTIKLSKESYVYDGKIKKPTVSVKGSNGKTISSSHYKVSYGKLYKSTGRYTVTITFKGNYTGTAKRTFEIRPKAVTVNSMTAKTKGFLLKWKKATGTMSGYQIQYAKNSKFSSAKTITITNPKTVSKTVSNLEGQAKYYVRIRTYKTVKGSRIYGLYSKTIAKETLSGNRHTYKSGFYYDTISKTVEKKITGKSYTENPNIKLSDLRYVKVKHYGFDGKVKSGEMIVNKKIADKTVKIFYELYQKKYQIQRMKLIDEYGADDNQSMSANNSSAFNYRVIAGSETLSKHAYGLAIDINPMVNPMVKNGVVSPENGSPYAERDVNRCTGKYKKHMIHKDDVIYKIFVKYGFSWGGNWKHSKDYQHFEYNK